jgi:hypothetical protein
MEFINLMMERVVAFWRNRRFFQFRKFQCPRDLESPMDGSPLSFIVTFIRLFISVTSTTKLDKNSFFSVFFFSFVALFHSRGIRNNATMNEQEENVFLWGKSNKLIRQWKVSWIVPHKRKCDQARSRMSQAFTTLECDTIERFILMSVLCSCWGLFAIIIIGNFFHHSSGHQTLSSLKLARLDGEKNSIKNN